MNDYLISIIIIFIYTLLMPAVIHRLEKHITRRWLLYILLIVVGLVLVTAIGTAASLLIYAVRGAR